MAQLRKRKNTDPSLPRPLSADYAKPPTEPSMFYSMLPTAVKSRLPRLPSLRKSASMYGMTTPWKGADERSRASTPEPDYTSAMVLSGGSRDIVGSDGDEVTGYCLEQMSSDEYSTQTTAGKTRQTLELSEEKSGIGWKFANQGLTLLSLAVEESSTISQDPRFGNPSFSRQLYVHALTYLLRALPSDLTTEEQLSVRSALPSGVVEPLRLELNHAYAGIQGQVAGGDHQPSLLHRALASAIIQFFVLFQFIVPYLKSLLTAAYQYDREHKISERVFSQSIETVDMLGKHGLNITSAIYAMGDGRVGQALNDIVSWLVDGVTGGIHDGVGEGLVIMGARRPSGSARRR